MGIPEESGRHKKQEKQERANIVVRIVDARKSMDFYRLQRSPLLILAGLKRMSKHSQKGNGRKECGS